MENDSKKTELARRLVALPHFKPCPGMLLAGPAFDEPVRLLSVDGDTVVTSDGFRGSVNYAYALPDLDDAATIGCLLALVREAWGCDPDIRGGARVEVAVGFAAFARGSLAEALVAALEAAP